ncbi:MAG: transposase [Thermodesulfovibrio sp.]|nr:transposase [Thermodesulfovibrio sp.]
MLVEPEIFDAQAQNKQTKKLGRPFISNSSNPVHTLFQIRLRLPYRQTEGFVRTLFREMGISIELPNFRTIHYRHNREDFHFDHLPDKSGETPQEFVIVLDSKGFFSSFKPWFGEYVSSVKLENIRKELMFKVMITSMFLSGSIGMIVR